MKSLSKALLLAALLGGFASPLAAAEMEVYDLVLKDHRFIPNRLEVPADRKVVLHLINQDDATEEFDSTDLKREKVVKGGQDIRIIVGPLSPGEYKFVGEYHEETAKGVLVVK